MSKLGSKLGGFNDKEFRAEADAHTLIESKAIQADKPRLNAAIKRAKGMVDDAKKRAAAANSVAKMKAKAVSKSKAKRK